MGFTWFNFMPWPYLPADFAKTHRSVWVDIDPNLFDPVRGHALYNSHLDLLEYAATLGFDGVGVNEHHQTAYGMMPSPDLFAAEMAALAPDKFARLTLISAMGLWLDDHPVADLFLTLPHDMPRLLFHDPDAAAKAMAHVEMIGGGWDPTRNDPDLLVAQVALRARQLGDAGKRQFPIPDRRLRQRLYRISAPTRVIWGAEDRVAPPAYGEAFAAAIPNARLTLVPEAGHMAHWEPPALVKEAAAFS